MEKILIISCMFVASTAVFFPLISLPNQRQTMMNICIYSVNPVRYQPKCFLCPSNVYPNVLQACVNAAAIPSNISFTQASCIEQNCAIGRGRRSVDDQQPDNLLEFEDNAPAYEQNNDVEQQLNDVEPTQPNNQQVVGEEEFFASDYEDLDEAADYEETNK